MPPDEYVTDVNNSAYTNTVAKTTFEMAARVAIILGLTNHTIYDYYARFLYIPFDEVGQFHPEYDGYIPGRLPVCCIDLY